MDNFLVSVALPLTLAFIMFTLGLGLRIADFLRVFQMPKAFLTGFVNQVVFLPVVGFILALAFGLPPELAVGMMILALSPGGATTNVLSKIAGGNVPLSISLTAVVTVISIVTVPLIVTWSVAFFLDGQAVQEVDTVALSIIMFLMTVLPVALGMVLTAVAPSLTARISGALSVLAVVFFALIIVAAIAANRQVLADNFAVLGLAVVILLVVMVSLGVMSARAVGLSPADGTTIAIESGIQNGTLGVAVSAIVAAQLIDGATGISAFGVPSAVYGAVMYFIVVPFVLWRRTHVKSAIADSAA